MRIKNSIKNTKYSMLAQLTNLLVQFISRTIFIQILGKEYLGLNGLFSNVLTILSLADMGIGTVLTYTMYEPLAEKNTIKLQQLMSTYKKIYRIIAVIIAITGVCLTPILPFLIKDLPDIPNITLIYLLYLINTVISYLYAYKISIINADQKNYITTINQQLFLIISNISMMIVLWFTHNYILYLITQIIFSFLSNLRLSRIADKMYPFVKNTKGHTLSIQEKKNIGKGAFAMILHKVGGVVINGTDNILISSMIGLNAVGIYSNYLLIINAVKQFLSAYSSSIIASIGNLSATEKAEKTHLVFKRILYSMFIFTSFCTICLFCLINNFITLWLGKSYTFSVVISGVIVSTFYITGMRQTALCFIDATGLFTKNKLKPIIESTLNLVLSIIITLKYGIIGIFLGTILSTVATCIFWEAHVLYKYLFHHNITEYIMLFLKYAIITVISTIIPYWISTFIGADNIYRFAAQAIITGSLALILPVAFTYKQKESQYFMKLIKQKIYKH